MNPVTCPYCDSPAICVDSAEVYGVSYGWMWKCYNGDCPAEGGSRVGCHRGTKEPLGRLADAKLRQARGEAHNIFDRLWRSGEWTRTESYQWLAEQLGIAFDNCHMALFDLEQCERVVEICRRGLK